MHTGVHRPAGRCALDPPGRAQGGDKPCGNNPTYRPKGWRFSTGGAAPGHRAPHRAVDNGARARRKAPRSKRPRGLPLTVVPTSPTGREPATAPTLRLRPGTRRRSRRTGPWAGRRRSDPRGPYGPLRRHPQPGRSPDRGGPSFSLRSRPRRCRHPPVAGEPVAVRWTGVRRGRCSSSRPARERAARAWGEQFSSTGVCTCCPQVHLREGAGRTGLCTESVDDARAPARPSGGAGRSVVPGSRPLGVSVRGASPCLRPARRAGGAPRRAGSTARAWSR